MIPPMFRIALALSCLSLLAVSAIAQQIPDTFTNLQALPKTISKQELVANMRGYVFALGVRCEHCHAAGKSPGSFDFASDEKATKRTARTMIRMTGDINRNYVMALTPPRTVDCVTCHRGSTDPRTLQAVLSDTLEHSGLDATVAQYRDLRKQNYGNGKYDFSETTLNLVSESLLREGKAKDAAAIMELNSEVNSPLTKWGFSCMAMAHRANKENQKAERDFEKILELDPKNEWATDQLKALRASP